MAKQNTIEVLNEKFGNKDKIHFSAGKGGLPVLNIMNDNAAAAIALHGAHILSYTPKGHTELLWMSDDSLFEAGKPIRGGIPVCFPWFGPHPTDPGKPQHGFARLQEWKIKNVQASGKGSTIVSLELSDTDASVQLWPYRFEAMMDFVIGKTLEVKLAVTNIGDEAFEYSDALHTYFHISDIAGIGIEGLHEATYYEAFAMDLKVQDAGTLHFDTETNRRYVNFVADCIIHDPGYKRNIRVGKKDSKVTVVWNPGEAVSKTIKDIQPGGFRNFVCVEPANAYEGIDMIRLKPGEKHTLSTIISIL